jgi:hypothetical protein
MRFAPTGGMKRIAALLFVFVACHGAQSGMTSVPGQGAVALQVTPNPIVAHRVSGNTYDFPFDVVVRETGGRPINVTRVTATVFAAGGITLGQESWDAERIRSMGYATTVNANGELRYHFAPQRDVPDERIFNSLSAELKVDAVDDTNAATSASSAVTITR